MCVCVCACVRACVRVRARACVSVCLFPAVRIDQKLHLKIHALKLFEVRILLFGRTFPL